MVNLRMGVKGLLSPGWRLPVWVSLRLPIKFPALLTLLHCYLAWISCWLFMGPAHMSPCWVPIAVNKSVARRTLDARKLISSQRLLNEKKSVHTVQIDASNFFLWKYIYILNTNCIICMLTSTVRWFHIPYAELLQTIYDRICR